VALASAVVSMALFAGCSAPAMPPVANPAAGPDPFEIPFIPIPARQAGMHSPTWYYNGYNQAEMDSFYPQIFEAGGRWVGLNVAFVMSTGTDSLVRRDEQRTASDDSIIHAVQMAHAAGLKVLVSPTVDVMDGQTGRTNISPNYPDLWFATYAWNIWALAGVAQAAGADEFSVGGDYEKLSPLTDSWRGVIGAVRSRFHGPIFYGATIYEYPNVQFWDALDFIGVKAYWSLSSEPTCDPAVLAQAWPPIVAQLEATSRQWGKPVIFAEAGYKSVEGSTVQPAKWTTDAPARQCDQAAGYESLLAAVWNRPWFAGVFWWQWDTPNVADRSRDYTPHTKEAEYVLRTYWR
jgi:hypothetical protein